MAKSTRNEFEFMSMVLDALGVEYEEADIKQRERWRGKVLDGWGVDYVVDDLKQFARWRQKCLEGLAKSSGSSDFSTATLTITNTSSASSYAVTVPVKIERGSNSASYGDVWVGANDTVTVDFVMYKGKAVITPMSGTIKSVTGNISLVDNQYIATGDCSINIGAGIN